jgi:alkylation response protein AidB-like acyl-CoA dehydrogenase
MNFLFSDEQRLFQRSVREQLEKTCTPAALRAETENGEEWSPQRWRSLADLGVTGMLVREEDGGLGRDELDLVLALEELGRAAAPEPLVDTGVVIRGLTRMTFPDMPDWLAQIAAGELAATYRRGSDGSTRITLLRSPGDVAMNVAGVEQHIGRHTDPAFDWAAFGTAAVLCGIAGRVIELAAAYAKERHQFGKPIGSFQAVKHLLADALLGLEFARPAVYRAAWSIAHDDPTVERDVSMAKALASDAAVNACRSALQVHGAIGYTHEHDLHLWLTKGFSLAHAWGTAAWHRERVGRAIL